MVDSFWTNISLLPCWKGWVGCYKSFLVLCIWSAVYLFESVYKWYYVIWSKSQLVECLGWKSIAHIPSPNLAPTPSISGNITGYDIASN